MLLILLRLLETFEYCCPAGGDLEDLGPWLSL